MINKQTVGYFTYFQAATRNYKIFLGLVTPVSSVRLEDSAGREVTGGVLVTRINSTVVVRCKAAGGDPAPSLAWTMSGGDRELVAETTTSPGQVAHHTHPLPGHLHPHPAPPGRT